MLSPGSLFFPPPPPAAPPSPPPPPAPGFPPHCVCTRLVVALLINLFCRSNKDVTQRRINDHPECRRPPSSCSSWKSATALNGSSSSTITSLTNSSVSSSKRTRSSPRSRIPVPVPRCCHPLPSRCRFFLYSLKVQSTKYRSRAELGNTS